MPHAALSAPWALDMLFPAGFGDGAIPGGPKVQEMAGVVEAAEGSILPAVADAAASGSLLTPAPASKQAE